MKKACWIVLVVAWLAALPAIAQVLPKTEPAEVGLSAERLGRLDALIERDIAKKQIAGTVTIIARHGKIAHFAAHGMADIENGKPMREDTIFRIASMSKAITSTAVMMLYEEGKFLLSDPVSKYLPEFSDMMVLPAAGAPNNNRVPARHPITIRNLLTHTSGLTYQWNQRLGPLYNSYHIPHGLGPTDFTLADFTRELAKLPLLFQPGERYEYGLSVDVLGRLVEVTSGRRFDQFLRERIFDPLGMKDTYFYLPDEKVSRLAVVYGRDGDKLERHEPEDKIQVGDAVGSTGYPFSGPKKFFSGGAGLSSTAPDYARFAQMILNKGELGGKRLLSPTTVKLMTMDHVGHIVANPPIAFGLGFSVDLAENGFDELTSEGTAGWSGFWYTEFFLSPSEDMIGVFMSQLSPSGDLTLNDQFKVMAHQAIVD